MEIPPAPPTAPTPTPASQEPFAIQAAKLCLWTPFIALLVGLFGGGRNPLLAAIAGGLLVIGVILGVVALFGIGRHGAGKILGRALAGIILSGILAIGLMISFFVDNRSKDQKGIADVRQELRKMKEGMRKEMETQGALQDNPEARKALKEAFNKSAEEVGDDSKPVFKAGAAYAERIEQASVGYRAALKELEAAEVLDTATIKEKADIQPRRELVDKFLSENKKLKRFLSNLEEVFTAELRKQTDNEKIIQTALTGYRSKAHSVNPVLVQIRVTDEQLGAAMLGILDVLEKNWGTWEGGEEGPLFENDANIDEYNTHFEKLQAAATKQEELQRKLLSAGQ